MGFTSSYVVVLTGLRSVGASPAEAASGLVAVCLAQALVTLWLSRRHRMPITVAWSTPGAALLATTGVVTGGWPAAVGAFLVVGALIVLTGAWTGLGRLVGSIPVPIAQAMLAGVVLPLCLVPVQGVATDPWSVLPVVLTWLVLLRLARTWAIPGAFVAALVVVGVGVVRDGGVDGPLLPALSWTTPDLTWAALLGIALPLYVVTMAGQNVPGVAIMSSYGYTVPWRPAMTATGLGTLAAAGAGGHAVNLAAITAALAANPDVHPDPARRWRASYTAGWCYVALAALATALTTFVSAAPDGVLGAVAGVALLGTLAGSVGQALADPADREAAVVTFVVAASGLSIAGVSAAFWALLAGLVVRAVTRSVAAPATRAGRR